MKELSFSEAKSRLSSVVDAALNGEDTVITRHGRREAVIVPYDDWARMRSPRARWDVLLNAPVDGSEFERSRSKMREFDF